MRNFVAVAVVAALMLGACQSRFNPINWFGKSESRPRPQAEEQTPQEEANPLIPEQSNTIFRDSLFKKDDTYAGQPVAEVTALTVERTANGAIIRATGRVERPGAYEVRLIPDREDGEAVNGVLSYTMAAMQPEKSELGSSGQTVQAAIFVPAAVLTEAREIRVGAARNIRITNR